MLKIHPSGRLHLDVRRGGAAAEDRVTLTNLFNVPVLYKILVKSDESAPARISAISPMGGLILPSKSAPVSVSALAAEEWGREAEDWLPIVGKLLVQWKPASDTLDLADCSGDKSASLWDATDDLCGKPQSQELEVFMTIVGGGDPAAAAAAALHIPSPVPQTRRKMGSFCSSTSPPPSPVAKSDSASVLHSIQDLVSSNEVLKAQVNDLEFQRQADLEMLAEAKREAEEAKMTSQLASHLVKQVEDLRMSKEALMEEMKNLQLKEQEKKDHLAEKDVKLQALQMESDRLCRENQRLKDVKNSDSFFDDQFTDRCFFSRKLDDIPVTTKSQESVLGQSETPRGPPPAPKSQTKECVDEGQFWEQTDLSKVERRRRRKKHWTCDDESLLFFLKTMTMLFGGLTFLAAMNILFSGE